MTDAAFDRELELSDRQTAIVDSQRAFAAAARLPAPPSNRGRLTRAEALARRGQAESTGVLAQAEVVVPSEPVAPKDAAASLRHAQIGFLFAATLILFLIWIMQRKKGVN